MKPLDSDRNTKETSEIKAPKKKLKKKSTPIKTSISSKSTRDTLTHTIDPSLNLVSQPPLSLPVVEYHHQDSEADEAVLSLKNSFSQKINQSRFQDKRTDSQETLTHSPCLGPKPQELNQNHLDKEEKNSVYEDDQVSEKHMGFLATQGTTRDPASKYMLLDDFVQKLETSQEILVKFKELGLQDSTSVDCALYVRRW